MNNLIKHLWIFIFLLNISCKNEKPIIDDNAPLFSLLDPVKTKVYFSNTSKETLHRNLAHYDYFYNGSGVAIGDLNNDNKPDIFFAGNDTSNKLYLNEGDFVFKDISRKSGIESNQWSTGVTMVDINEDGYLDIYVCNSGPNLDDKMLSNKLYINNGDLTFTESATLFGIDDTSYSSQAAFFDMDKDGDLDLFVLNHSLLNYGKSIQEWEQVLREEGPRILKKSCNTLYRNNGNGKFTDITEESGIFRPGFGLGISITDFNEDGFLDIYISNDYFIPDFLFFNNGDGTFTENLKGKASHSSFYSMGCDAADFNNDGLIDLVAVDMTPADHFRGKTLMESMDVKRFSYLVEEKGYVPQYMYNTLNLNRSGGNFSEIAHYSGIAETDWSWAPLLVDLDNDSNKDLVVTNGFKRDTKNQDWSRELKDRFEKEGATIEVNFDQIKKANSKPLANYVYKNIGNLKFEDKSKEWGFAKPSFSNGSAYGDLDNDGDLDMVINNLEGNSFIYRNNTADKQNSHFIQLTLKDGDKSASVMHSKIKLFSGGQSQLIEYSFVRGYLSTMQPLAHFGLGKKEKVDKIEIIWPDGKFSTIINPEIDKRHIIDKSIISTSLYEKEEMRPPFMDITNQSGLTNYQHVENSYDDFYSEVLLPHKQSTLGPCLSTGDVNGDGIQDFFIGGAKGQSGQIYIQDPQKGLFKSSQKDIEFDAENEDLSSLFFDVDLDGDLDLYVCSGGGGEFKGNSIRLQDRLYINNGNGNFIKSEKSLPKINSSTGSVTANDWDGDGDLDLFVGGRTKPGEYPVSPTSYLLENENGVFLDKTISLAPTLQKIGMVTSSTWVDINNDGLDDLIVVGEWMPISVFLNSSNGFIEATDSLGLTNTIGWWYSINKGDFDNDGDDDFIVGNIGLNNKYHPTEDKPLHIFSNDFDNNETLDIVLSKYYKGNLTPTRGKECSTQQMPFIKDSFPLFSDFASSTLEEIYGAENLNNALHYEAKQFASIYIENKGDGNLRIRELAAEAQLSPINDMVIWDFNKDGNLDVVIGGNMYNTEVETPSYDAGKGLFLQGKGDGTFFSYTKIKDSGIFLPQNVKALELFLLSEEKRPSILAANNNGILQLFAWIR